MSELSILAAAAEAPTRDCLIADGKAWSYADVADRVRVAMAALRDRGLEAGQRVAQTPDVVVDSAIWLYASFELGCPAVLLHPQLTSKERARLIDKAKPALVIGTAPPLDEPSNLAPVREPIPSERVLAIVFTSGTGGEARGACLSRRAFLASAAAHAGNLGWLPDDRWLLSMPLAHVGGLSILTRCLIARRSVVLSPGRFDPVETMRVLARDRVTLMSVVPTMLSRLLASRDPVWTPNPELRAVLVGGAPLSDRLRAQALQRNVPVVATYGCTEACSQISTQTWEQSGKPGSGAPLDGVQVRIRNEEIQVRGETLMDGYLGENATRKPWTEDGWLRTGDFGAFAADGQLLVRGRLDDLIVTGGENVAPQEVEAWLDTIRGVLGACVFSIPHEEWGEQVVAALEVDPARYDPGALRAQLADGLASYKQPKQICLLEAMPLNRSGKVDRVAVAFQCKGKLQPI